MRRSLQRLVTCHVRGPLSNLTTKTVTVKLDLIKGPKGPEPALGFFEKKKPDCPKKSGLPRRHVVNKQSNKTTKVFAQQARGSRERFFVLRYYYYVDVTFSSTLR